MTTPTTPIDAMLPPLPVAAYIPPERESEYHGSDHVDAYRTQKAGWVPLCRVSDAQAHAHAAQQCAELAAKLAELTAENQNLLHALKAELQGQTFMGEPFIPALTPKEHQ